MRRVLTGDKSYGSRRQLGPRWGVARLQADWKLRRHLARLTSQLAVNEAVTEVNEIANEAVKTEVRRGCRPTCG